MCLELNIAHPSARPSVLRLSESTKVFFLWQYWRHFTAFLLFTYSGSSLSKCRLFPTSVSSAQSILPFLLLTLAIVSYQVQQSSRSGPLTTGTSNESWCWSMGAALLLPTPSVCTYMTGQMQRINFPDLIEKTDLLMFLLYTHKGQVGLQNVWTLWA